MTIPSTILFYSDNHRVLLNISPLNLTYLWYGSPHQLLYIIVKYQHKMNAQISQMSKNIWLI